MHLTENKATKVLRPSTEELIHFITEYRKIESSVFDYGYSIIRNVWFNYAPKNLSEYNHMCDKWHHNRKDFGSFILGSLSHKQLMQLLRHWGITDPYDLDYAEACVQDHTYQFLNPPPAKTQMFHKMMLFFNNHGINQNPIPEIKLDTLPKDKDRFGNSKNWGKYILGLQDPNKFFDDLFKHYHG